jgi:hypothetical protein
MKTTNILIAAIAPFLTLFTQFVPSANAQYLSDCNVRIVGRVRGTQVNLREGAGTEYRSPAYLLVGQYVNMLNNSSGNRISRQDSEGSTWYYIEYEPSGTRGWIREDFIAPQCS